MKAFLQKFILGTDRGRGGAPSRHLPAAHFVLPRLGNHTHQDGVSPDDSQENPAEASSTDQEVKIVLQRSRSQKDANSFLTYFLAFPPELQLMVLSFLDFGDIERLRRSCKFFRIRISKPLIRSLFPELGSRLRKTCYLCLTHYSSGAEVVSTDASDARYPLSSRCVSCIIKNKGFMVGRKYVMGNDVPVYVCRWCGYPVVSSPAWNQPEFHKKCFRRYTHVVFAYYFFGLAQWAIMIIASALCWQYYQGNVAVLAPTIIGFIVSLWSFCLSTVRGSWMRTYHFSLFCEASILATWIVATIAIFDELDQPNRDARASDSAALAFVAFNMIFRLFNVIGNLILLFEYKIWRHKTANMSRLRQMWIRAIEIFIFFAEPQCVEQEYPGIWWFRRRRPTLHQGVDDVEDIVEVDINAVAGWEALEEAGITLHLVDQDAVTDSSSQMGETGATVQLVNPYVATRSSSLQIEGADVTELPDNPGSEPAEVTGHVVNGRVVDAM